LDGKPTGGCKRGWKKPTPGSLLFREPLKVIGNSVKMKGPLKVVDMRYFVGPESPPSVKVEVFVVQRWYLKAYSPRDKAFRGRFIVEKRMFGSGVSAVAPFDTHGFISPDWTGFQWNSEDRSMHKYPGLPGAWQGTPYNFVTGGEGLTLPGLPPQATGCMADT
jgi:hypothetical protein